jgi:hypothetical protein
MSKHSGHGAVLIRVGVMSQPRHFRSVVDAEAEAKRQAQGGDAEFIVYEPTKRIVSSVDTIKINGDKS